MTQGGPFPVATPWSHHAGKRQAHFGAAAADGPRPPDSLGDSCWEHRGSRPVMLVMEVMVPRQLDLSSIVGKVMLKSAWSASNPRGVHVRRSVWPGRGARAMTAAFRRWTACATA